MEQTKKEEAKEEVKNNAKLFFLLVIFAGIIIIGMVSINKFGTYGGDGGFVFPPELPEDAIQSEKDPVLNSEGQVIAIEDPATGQTVPISTCLADAEVVLYYLDTCPHCHTQLAMFAFPEFLNKIECSENPDACRGVRSVPTWRFNNGIYTGVLSLNQLAEASGCYP